MADRVPWYMRSTSSSNPFTTVGIDWCPRCKKEVDTNSSALHQGSTYTFKRWCAECGRVIAHGIYDQVCVLSNKPLPPAALEWNITPGKDRR